MYSGSGKISQCLRLQLHQNYGLILRDGYEKWSTGEEKGGGLQLPHSPEIHFGSAMKTVGLGSLQKSNEEKRTSYESPSDGVRSGAVHISDYLTSNYLIFGLFDVSVKYSLPVI